MAKRWVQLDKVLLVVIGLIVWFAYMDSKQVMSFLTINTPQAWDLYYAYTGPAIWNTWYIVILAVGIIWYVVYKDMSESAGLVAAGWSLIWFGTQDILYFFFSQQTLSGNLCWATIIPPIRLISRALGECCPSSLTFIISGVLGVVVSYVVYNAFKRAKW